MAVAVSIGVDSPRGSLFTIRACACRLGSVLIGRAHRNGAWLEVWSLAWIVSETYVSGEQPERLTPLQMLRWHHSLMQHSKHHQLLFF